MKQKTNTSAWLCGAILFGLVSACAGDSRWEGQQADEATLDDTAEQAAALAVSSNNGEGRPLWEAYQAYVNRAVAQRAAAGAPGDSLGVYSAKCDIATRIHVPSFNCDTGTEVPNQGNTPSMGRNATHCDRPNVLNGVCDPGSKFQVLVSTPDAVAVAHCRKDGLPVLGSSYNDVAVIQYNKKNGALCFYQALGYGNGALAGQNVAAPSQGEAAWRWLTPAATEAINCTGCHDNGGLIRSEYLAQLTGGPTPLRGKADGFAGPYRLPSTADGFDNKTTALSYVGADFVTNRSWSVTAPPASCPSGSCLACTTCHRLGVNNYHAFNIINGTAGHFANVATAPTQDSKNPHGTASPIWMRPGQVTYSAEAEASATNFKNCATGFWSGKTDGFTSGTPTAGCTFTPLGTTFTGISPVKINSSANQLTLD